MSAPGQPDRDDPHDALGSVFLASTENAIVGPSLPFELLIYIYEFLLTPDARLTQKAQLSFRAVCRHWRKAAYRSDLFVRGSKVFRLLEYLEQEPETQRTDVVSLRMKFGYTDPSFQVDTLRRLLNSLPRLRELCLAGTKINTGHLSRIAAAPCGAGLVSLRLDLNGGPAGVFFDYEASFPSLEEFGLEGPFGSYVTNYPFPPPQLSSLFLPTWSDGGEELKPLLVAASARNASLKKLVLPFDAWCDLTDPSVVDEYLSNALDGLRKLSLVRSGQTWGLLSADEERAQVNDTHLHPRFWPKELRTLDLTSMQFQKETSLLKFILESISDTRRAAREPHLQQQQHERSLDLILAANVRCSRSRGGRNVHVEKVISDVLWYCVSARPRRCRRDAAGASSYQALRRLRG